MLFSTDLAMQKFSLLGSTGSIGTQTLDIVREHSEKFEIVAIAAGRNIELLAGSRRQRPVQHNPAASIYYPKSAKLQSHAFAIPANCPHKCYLLPMRDADEITYL